MAVSMYERNIEALKARYSNVVEYLERNDSEKNPFPEETDIEIGVQDVCGKTVMCAQKGDRTYQLDSLYDSNVLLELWFNSLGEDWGLGAKLLMYGLGNGMYARKFLTSARSDCSIVIHEPSEKMFRAAIENFDMTQLFADIRVRLVFWPLYRGQKEIKFFYEDIIEYKDLGSRKTAFYGNYPRLFEQDCHDYINGVRRAEDFVLSDQVVQDRFGGDYNRNLFNNLKYIPDSLSFEDLINNMPEDVPAIVIAAGPSLDSNINDLKAAQGKCLMISTDTALKPLALAGITPDVSAIMDGKKDARYLSEESSKRVPMFCTPRSGDTFMNLHTGVKFFTNNLCNQIKQFMDNEGCYFDLLPTGGSVANSCFGLAEMLHCKRIILVGQDLAYTGDKTHSKVTVRGAKETAVEDLEHVVMSVDINGDPIRSSREFTLYKEWFEDEIARHPDLHVIDATEGGVMIKGTTLMTLKDAIEQECTDDFDFKSVLERVGPLLSGDKKQRFVDLVRKMPHQLSELKRLINISLTDYRSMKKLILAGNYNSSQFRRLYKETQDISRKVEESPVIEYVHNQLQERTSKMLDEVNKLEKDEKSELYAACELGEGYLQDMIDSIGELEPYIEKMKEEFGL